MWLKIIRQNLSQLARRAKGSASIEQKNGNGTSNKANKTNNNGAELNRNDEQNGSLDKSQAKKKSVPPAGTPLLQQTEISTSQLDFFRMLDEKIESGPDYDESKDPTMRSEHVADLLRSWELASISWSKFAINNTQISNVKSQYQSQQQQQQQQQSLYANQTQPSRGLGVNLQQQQQQYQYQHPHRGPLHKTLPPPVSGMNTSLSAKDREGMRNIIGGRPESAPVYVQRFGSVNRMDGIQDVVGHHHHQQYPYQQQQQQQFQQAHGASPSMPRHVLESISQSPTQSSKTPPGISSPTSLSRYPHYHHPELLQSQQSPKPQYNPLNGADYYQHQQPQDYYRREQYDSPILLRNSPSNPYVHKFHINTLPSPQASPINTQQQIMSPQQQQQYGVVRQQRNKRTGVYGTAQMT